MAKKLKKAFALLLALSMVMSLLSITAFAEGGAADEAKIVDDIAKNGALKVVGLPDEDASNVWYWYQSVDGKDFTKVPRSGMATSIDIVDEAVENLTSACIIGCRALRAARNLQRTACGFRILEICRTGALKDPL